MRSHSDLFVSPPKRRGICSDKNAIIYSNKVSYNVDSWITASGGKKVERNGGNANYAPWVLPNEWKENKTEGSYTVFVQPGLVMWFF